MAAPRDKLMKPMLIAELQEPFDDPDYFFELKLDGDRCVAYLNQNGVELRNKRDLKMDPKFPELADMNQWVKKPCILDGELIVMKGGEPDFYEVQRRALLSNRFKIELASAKSPATFAAFDILWLDGKDLTGLPLEERKKLLAQNVRENARLAVARYVEGNGTALFQLAKERRLEGIVAKKKDSKYYPGKRTKDWIKIKYLKDGDFVIGGYIEKAEHVVSLVLGQYRGKDLIYKGHVTMGISRGDFRVVQSAVERAQPPFLAVPSGHGNEQAVWLEPELVCTVSFLPRKDAESVQHPVYKGLRRDKEAKDCVEVRLDE